MPKATPGMPCSRMPARILASSSSKSEPAARPPGTDVWASTAAGRPTRDVAVAAAATVPVAVLRNSLRVSRLGCCGHICSLPSLGQVSSAAQQPPSALLLFTLPRELAHPSKELDYVLSRALPGAVFRKV